MARCCSPEAHKEGLGPAFQALENRRSALPQILDRDHGMCGGESGGRRCSFLIGPPFHAVSEPFIQVSTFIGYKTLKNNVGLFLQLKETLPHHQKRVLWKAFLNDCGSFWFLWWQLLGSMSQKPNSFKEQLSGLTLNILSRFEVLWVRTLASDCAVQLITPEACLSFS